MMKFAEKLLDYMFKKHSLCSSEFVILALFMVFVSCNYILVSTEHRVEKEIVLFIGSLVSGYIAFAFGKKKAISELGGDANAVSN